MSLRVEFRKWEVRKKQRTFGKTIIFCDEFRWSSGQIIDAYHGKNIIEENFKFLNRRSYLHFEPVYHWTDQKIKVHALMCVIGLLLVRLLIYRASRIGLKLNLDRMMWELHDIEEIILLYSPDRVIKKITRLNETQKKLFQLFGLFAYQDSS